MRGRLKTAVVHNNIHFSHFAAVSLWWVASLADTFPSFPVSGPFLPDVPGFQVLPDSTFPPQLRSSYRALPLHLHFDNCADVFCFISSFDVPEAFNLLLLITIAIGSTFPSPRSPHLSGVQTGSSPLPIAPFSSQHTSPGPHFKQCDPFVHSFKDQLSYPYDAVLHTNDLTTCFFSI